MVFANTWIKWHLELNKTKTYTLRIKLKKDWENKTNNSIKGKGNKIVTFILPFWNMFFLLKVKHHVLF